VLENSNIQGNLISGSLGEKDKSIFELKCIQIQKIIVIDSTLSIYPILK
jgi:hypothetical protein